MTAPMLAQDTAAQAAADLAGLLHVPTVALGSELTAQKAVFMALSWHLARLRGRLENFTTPASPTALLLKSVECEWPKSWDAALYPRATIVPVTTAEDSAMCVVPVTELELGARVDVVTDDQALWLRGEDTGEGVVIVMANSPAEAEALGKAVRDALGGSLDVLTGAGLPLPYLYLPAAFRGRLTPHARLMRKSGGDSMERSAQAEGGGWRFDVHFTWQAPTFEARARIPDFNPDPVVVVPIP